MMSSLPARKKNQGPSAAFKRPGPEVFWGGSLETGVHFLAPLPPGGF